MNAVGGTVRSYFFAYSGQPSLRAETMRDAVAATRQRGLAASTWEDLRIEGRLLIDPILEAINEADGCIAEVSSTNPNVLFEAGYALALGKEVHFAIDESDQEATRAWTGLAFMDTVGRIEYGGNPHVLADRIAALAGNPPPPLIESLLAEARPREANAVFAPGVPHKFNAADRLERLLERKTHLKLLASQDELGLAGLAYYAQELYRSSAGIFHFMKPTRLRAETYNARLALLAGIAHGYQIPILMVAEEGYHPPLDYRDLLYRYPSTARLTEYVSNWLSTIPSPRASRHRLGRIKLDIELPVRSFGQFVAESEKESLPDYFIHTNEFEAVLSGRASIFTGRKGTGKTANMQQAVEDLRADRRILVVPVKPSSYDLAGLIEVIGRFADPSKRDYFLVSLWSYLLVSEIAVRVLSHADDLPAGEGGDARLQELSEALQRIGIDRSGDLAVRLDDVIAGARGKGSSSDDLSKVIDTLRNNWVSHLLPVLRPALQRYGRVAMFVDNLDKTWEKDVNFELLSQFLLSLLVTSGRLRHEFRSSRRDRISIDLSLSIFLRTDIYDVLTRYAREPDKINPQNIQWEDEELLIRVLEDRYLANRKSEATAESLWTDVFASEVHSLSTRDYFLWRALRRPRDIIFLGNAALTTAINRQHQMVLAQDFVHAEKNYSRFAVEALLVESEAQGFDLEELLFEFAGLDSTVTSDELDEVLSLTHRSDEVRTWLIRTSFLGLETRDGRFVHVEGESEARKKLKAAERLAARLNRQLRYRVHPAFRPYLDVRDDDVHDSPT